MVDSNAAVGVAENIQGLALSPEGRIVVSREAQDGVINIALQQKPGLRELIANMIREGKFEERLRNAPAIEEHNEQEDGEGA